MSETKDATSDRPVRFSETLWFKKGEADADAEADPADGLPIEDRYNDDGSLTGGDAARYGLRTGSTSQLPTLGAAPAPRRRKPVSERELIREMTRSPAIVVAAVSAVAILAAIARVILS
jgi:hypothetical protein